jgi:4-amino-4-deoxy-L-arabinose transferase-like glycosyltransferase
MGAGFSVQKKYLYLMVLAGILVYGYALRNYHVDYPVIGYHNWKETHYLTEARNFARDGFFAHGFFIPEWDYPALKANPAGAHTDTFPMTSVLTAIGFRLFGIDLAVARTISILFSLGTIVIMYLLVLRLSDRQDFALTAALLTALNPLFVFFSHNTQLVNQGVFFMLCAAYFYVKWLHDKKGSSLILTSVFLTLGTITKYSFFVITVPMLFTFPWKRLMKWERYGMHFIVAALIFLAVPGWLLYNKAHNAEIGGYSATSDVMESFRSVGVVFTSQFWTTMRAYFADNFSLLGVYLALAGLAVLLATAGETW